MGGPSFDVQVVGREFVSQLSNKADECCGVAMVKYWKDADESLEVQIPGRQKFLAQGNHTVHNPEGSSNRT